MNELRIKPYSLWHCPSGELPVVLGRFDALEEVANFLNSRGYAPPAMEPDQAVRGIPLWVGLLFAAVIGFSIATVLMHGGVL